MDEVSAKRLAWSGTALSFALVTAGLVLSVLAISRGRGGPELQPHQYFQPIFTLSYSLVGAMIASHRPRNPIGWLLLVTGFLSSVNLFGLGYQMSSQLMTPDDSLPGVALAEWLASWVWFPQIAIPLTFVLLIFPDGRLPSARWRPVAWLAGLGMAAGVVSLALRPALADSGGPEFTELTPVTSAVQALASVGNLLLAVGFLASMVSLIVRYRRAGPTERDQLKWLIYIVGVALIGSGVIWAGLVGLGQPELMAGELGIMVSIVMVMSVIVAVGIAIVRHRLYDIDLLINRTLVYGVLTALIIALYVLVVTSLGALLQARGSLVLSLFGVGVVAVVVQPLRERLQRAVNRLMYGERDDPYAVLSRLGQRLEGALAPAAVLSALVDTVAQSLKLPYVAIETGSSAGGGVAAAYGQPASRQERFPLIFQAETVGQLVIGSRASGEAFNPAERKLLQDIAHQAGAAVHAAQLTADLQRSRVRLVTAREEERRRLRRDLHDGLGPILASQGLKLAATRQLLERDPGSAEVLLDQMIAQNEASVAEIRRLVYGLRPPALDERGLVHAIRDHVAGLGGNNDAPGFLRVKVESTPADLPDLPAAVEVAAFRIALEALTNVVRHAGAHHCAIRFSLGSNGRGTFLRVEISDDGAGIPESAKPGVGLRSMRERAEELGGSLTVEPAPSGGTIVAADLPLDGEA